MQNLTFELEGDYVELNMLLKLSGLCDSGGAGKALVASGAVRVDGAVESRKTAKIRAGQVVEQGQVGRDLVQARGEVRAAKRVEVVESGGLERQAQDQRRRASAHAPAFAAGRARQASSQRERFSNSAGGR